MTKREYTQALTKDLEDAAAYNNQGTVYSDKKEYDKAIADYTRVLVKKLNYVLASMNGGGKIYYETKNIIIHLLILKRQLK